jgi:hypothetical protein
MEELPTLYNGVPLAKHDELLARLRNSDPDRIYPYQLPPAEFHAHIAACIDAARAPWERGKDRTGIVVEPDDDELVEAVPVPRRQRKRSLATVLAAARKAGADRVVVDGVTIALSPAAAVPESVSLTDSTGNEWDAMLEDGHAPH